MRLIIVLFVCALAYGQQKVDLVNRHERAFAVVPLVGAGTWADPKRPLFAPQNLANSPFLSYTYEIADNGQIAIVEFVARDRSAFQQLRGDIRVQKLLEKGSAQPAEIEAELRRFKRDFSLTRRPR